VLRTGNAVLLEGSIDGITGELGGKAERLVCLLAECAGKAGVIQPLHTDSLANFAILICDTLASSNDDTCTLVTTNEW